jgi:N-carbamoylputrescine amidase
VKVALITEVFWNDGCETLLDECLAAAKADGASLAVLPELPLNPWSPATREVRDDDAEDPEGPRHRIQASAARRAGIGLMGGAIVRDAATGTRHNNALIFDAEGELRGRYRKAHLPEEDGYWETSHYEPSDDIPRVIDGFDLRLGAQICSDVNRPEGSHVLGAKGAELILAPRCTPASSYGRWKLVLRANAVTSCAFVISTNRPRPEQGVPIGGASIAIAPDGEVLAESTDRVCVVDLDPAALRAAREDYPGYIAVRSDLYARAWSEV